MKLLAESENYLIANEYEKVFLRNKATGKQTLIGDFYGDPEGAVISCDEEYCVMFGWGLILYYLAEPFEEYQYHTATNQWNEWGRTNQENSVWIKGITKINKHVIEFLTEDDRKIILNITVRSVLNC